MTWQKELKSNINNINDLKKYFYISKRECILLKKIVKRHPMSVSKFYLSLINFEDPEDPLKKMIIPSLEELNLTGSYDTSDEKSNTKFLGFQHKYSQTGLLLATHKCASYCRFCFRKRMIGLSKEEILQNLSRARRYIENHKEINNVLISGGDPFMLSTKIIADFLEKLTDIPSLDFIRFGTKIPVYFPNRFLLDEELIVILKKYSKRKKKIYIVLQVEHPKEITKELQIVVNKLIDSGIILNSQTVLLKGVNDSPEILSKLQNKLVSIGVNPYYIFQCRPVKRVKNSFQLPLYKGYKIIEEAKKMLNGHSKRFKYVMSHKTGKIEILGIMNDEIYFKYHQAKDKKNSSRFFKKKLIKSAGWLDDFD